MKHTHSENASDRMKAICVAVFSKATFGQETLQLPSLLTSLVASIVYCDVEPVFVDISCIILV